MARWAAWVLIAIGSAIGAAGCQRELLRAADAGMTGGAGMPGAGGVGMGTAGAGGARDAAVDSPFVPGSRANGQGCVAAADCTSGFCADGICCVSACEAPCKSCALGGSAGSCLNVPAGAADPRATCADEGAASCGLNGTCDGAGACARYAPGTTCMAGECSENSVMREYVCDERGACKHGPTKICVPYVCDAATARCKTDCASDADCIGRPCFQGRCERPSGRCVPGQCPSGLCADGVCCSTACEGPCVSCALIGREGTCTPIVAGAADPRNVCAREAGCGRTGTCDGRGGCALAPVGAICSRATCVSEVYTPPGTCNGNGGCVLSDPISCAPPNGCSADGQCQTGCLNDTVCLAGNFCAGVLGCMPARGTGTACTRNAECRTGVCADGVCCTMACGGACRSCAIPGQEGTCTAVPTGTADPHAVCVDQGAAMCRTNGRCDGSGGCAAYPPGTRCAEPGCSDGVIRGASTCDGAGNCAGAPLISCAPFGCEPGTTYCRSSCQSLADCAVGYMCLNGRCARSQPTGPCVSGAECATGHCVGGTCCNTACTGSCDSCALPGTIGSCVRDPAKCPP